MTCRTRAACAGVGVTLACVLLAGCASGRKDTVAAKQGASGATVSGPPTVRPGQPVTFAARGFRPGDTLRVVLQPTAGATCCAAGVKTLFPVRDNGTATLAFTMPSTYRRCSTKLSGVCRQIAWRPGERVTVTVTGYLQNAQTRFVVSNRNE